MRDIHGMHHFHKRKGGKKDSKLINFFDKFVYVAGILGWIMTLPQLFNVWILKEIAGVSFITWVTYDLIALVWVGYGILHKDKHLVIIYSGWLVLDALIVMGILLY